MSNCIKKNYLDNEILKKLKIVEDGDIDKAFNPIRAIISNHWKLSDKMVLNKKDDKLNNNHSIGNQIHLLTKKNFYQNDENILNKKLFGNTNKTNLTSHSNSVTNLSVNLTKISKPYENTIFSKKKKVINFSLSDKNKGKNISLSEKKTLMQQLFQTYENEKYQNDSDKKIVYYNAKNLKNIDLNLESSSPVIMKSVIHAKSLNSPDLNKIIRNSKTICKPNYQSNLRKFTSYCFNEKMIKNLSKLKKISNILTRVDCTYDENCEKTKQTELNSPEKNKLSLSLNVGKISKFPRFFSVEKKKEEFQFSPQKKFTGFGNDEMKSSIIKSLDVSPLINYDDSCNSFEEYDIEMEIEKNTNTQKKNIIIHTQNKFNYDTENNENMHGKKNLTKIFNLPKRKTTYNKVINKKILISENTIQDFMKSDYFKSTKETLNLKDDLSKIKNKALNQMFKRENKNV